MIELPTIQGMLVADNSALEDIQQCPYLYYIKNIRRRVNSSTSSGLNFGGALHEALRVRYRRCNNNACDDETQQLMIKELENWFSIKPALVGDHRTLELAIAFVKMYNRVYKREPFLIIPVKGVMIVEKPFMFKLGTISDGRHVIFIGKMDLGVTDNSGIWVFDHKSTFAFGKGFEEDMQITPQFRGYARAVKEICGVMPEGYIINAMRVRQPTDESFFTEDKGIRPDDFKRMQYPFSYRELEEWEQNTMEMFEELAHYEKRGVFPRHRKNCISRYGRCSMYDLCMMNIDQRENWMMGNAFEDNTWSPLNIPERTSEGVTVSTGISTKLSTNNK